MVGAFQQAFGFSKVEATDYVFATGNCAEVQPCTRIEDREMQPGPVFRRARELYLEFAKATARPR